MSQFMWIVLSVALTVFARAGAVSDARSQRIPNRLVLAGLLLALVLRAGSGLTPLAYGLAGGAIAFVIGFPLFALRAFGGGDVKFLTVCGLFVGLPLIGKTALFSGAAGGILALIVIARRRLPLVAALRTWNLMRHAATLGQNGERMTLQDEGAIAAPYAVAIATGALIAWFGTAGGWIP
jgi:prepilin peptidase CpaA